MNDFRYFFWRTWKKVRVTYLSMFLTLCYTHAKSKMPYDDYLYLLMTEQSYEVSEKREIE
jgi:hypothetical protein